MSFEEYFKDWTKVVDKQDLNRMVHIINSLYKSKKCSPEYCNIFKVFNVTPYKDLHTVMLFQDPYPNNRATGIALGNNVEGDSNISPSLSVLKEAVIDYTIPHYEITFDNSLESWCKQGILMLNTSLTTEYSKPGSHSVLWRDFMIKLIKNISLNNPGLIWVLWGSSAKSFKPYIISGNIIEEKHPAYYARNNCKISSIFFKQLKQKIKYLFDVDTKWY